MRSTTTTGKQIIYIKKKLIRCSFIMFFYWITVIIGTHFLRGRWLHDFGSARPSCTRCTYRKIYDVAQSG